jgi:hypothetical protein
MGWNIIDGIYTVLKDVECIIYTDGNGFHSIECESITFALIEELKIYIEKNTELEIDSFSAKKNKVIINLA